jgi:hypothetical protein
MRGDLRFTIYDLRFAIYDLRFTICDLRFAIYDLRFAIYDLRFAIYARAKAPSLLRPAGAVQNRMVVMFRHRTPNMQAKGGVNLSLSAATSGAHPAPKLNHAALVVECRGVFP